MSRNWSSSSELSVLLTIFRLFYLAARGGQASAKLPRFALHPSRCAKLAGPFHSRAVDGYGFASGLSSPLSSKLKFQTCSTGLITHG